MHPTQMPEAFAAFRRAVADEAVNYVRRHIDFTAPDFQEVWRNYFLGLPGPTELRKKLSRDQQYFSVIRTHYSEIDRSFERIRDIALYVRRFPYSRTSISRGRNLRHNIEAYYQELYLLRERLLAFLPVLRKKFRHHSERSRIDSAITTAADLVNTTLANAVLVRGTHVHQVRFTDFDLDRLDTLELLVENDPDPLMRAFYLSEYRRIRKAWSGRIKADAATLKTLLDAYFALLNEFLLKAGALQYPPAPRRGA